MPDPQQKQSRQQMGLPQDMSPDAGAPLGRPDRSLVGESVGAATVDSDGNPEDASLGATLGVTPVRGGASFGEPDRDLDGETLGGVLGNVEIVGASVDSESSLDQTR